MPFFDDSPRSKFNLTSKPGLSQSASSLGLLSTEGESTNPVPVPTTGDLSGPETGETNILPAQGSPFAPAVTRQLTFQQNSDVTRVLSGILSDTTDASLKRAPVVIKGEMKRRQPPAPSSIPHHKRRLYVTLAGILSLVLVASFALIAATPLGRDLNQKFNPLSLNGSIVKNLNGGSNSLIAQATATAAYYQQNDGYDPNSNGGQTISNGSGSLNWPLGQCTFWANYRYHQLTGYWVPWSGNADQWVAGARAAGWTVSTSPHIPSIIVLMPYVQGASYYGHVAVVESIVSNATPTTVDTSNMNWWANGGGWDRVSYFDFTVGSGVYFVWHI